MSETLSAVSTIAVDGDSQLGARLLPRIHLGGFGHDHGALPSS